MIGLILIVTSWMLLRLENKPLSVLGFNRPSQRGLEFLLGFLVTGSFASIQFLLSAHFDEFKWILNHDISLSQILEGLRWNLNSILYEELLFRGYLLYKAIEILDERKGCFLSATVFGIYHWFSYEVLGNLAPMVYIFIVTGMFGLMLAYSFAKSRSIILPIALHSGWNIVSILVFSNGPIGKQLLIPSQPVDSQLSGLEQLLVNGILPLVLPLLVLWVVIYKIPAYRCVELKT